MEKEIICTCDMLFDFNGNPVLQDLNLELLNEQIERKKHSLKDTLYYYGLFHIYTDNSEKLEINRDRKCIIL